MFRTVKKWLDRSLEFLTALTMGVLVLDVTWQVITRFILKDPSSWTEELATFLMIWVGLLGAAVALNRGAHLGIDYFVGKFSVKNRLLSQIFVFAVVAGFALLVLMIGGWRLVALTFRWGQTSPALSLPMGYVYLAAPVSGFFMLIYSIEFCVESILKYMKTKSISSGGAAEE
ncbi:TRAP transporter small permease [candidate division KSB1 bacterium]|nr:TRAP transporter small permease [candidate division KSB1 bacterium]